MDRDALDRARRRIAAAGSDAELQATVPERLEGAIQDGMKAEVLPVARHIAEVRGLTGQVIRRLETVGADVAAERAARIEDLALLVDLVASGWRGVERRLDRMERILDRLERSLEDQPNAPVYRIERGA